jgi:hypothetical protein
MTGAHEHGVGEKIVDPGRASGGQPAEVVDLNHGGGGSDVMGIVMVVVVVVVMVVR